MPGISDVAEVAGGGTHTCAARGDGSLWCWGHPTYGVLGGGDDAPYTNDGNPPELVPLADVVEVGAGGTFTCAPRGKGTVWCWGEGGFLGTGNQEDAASPLQVTW